METVFTSPVGLTIGTFDGVHLGHVALLHDLRKKVSGTLTVFTFSNHPSEAFSNTSPVPLLITTEHKEKLLKKAGADIVILSPFNLEFANQSFDQFLLNLYEHFHFSHLILGEGATFGKNKQGTEEQVRAFGKGHHFQVDYFSKIHYKNQPISSGRIRDTVRKGNLLEAEHLLGRPYSIYSPLMQNNDGFNLRPPPLCLPPDGIYLIQIIADEIPVFGKIHIDRTSPILKMELPSSFSYPKNPLVEAIFLSLQSSS